LWTGKGLLIQVFSVHIRVRRGRRDRMVVDLQLSKLIQILLQLSKLIQILLQLSKLIQI
jgi:hypothetical protein